MLPSLYSGVRNALADVWGDTVEAFRRNTGRACATQKCVAMRHLVEEPPVAGEGRDGGWDTTQWSEKIVYSYWADGTLNQESYWSWNGSAAEQRRVVGHSADPQRRTWQSWGTGDGSFTGVSAFDGAGPDGQRSTRRRPSAAG